MEIYPDRKKLIIKGQCLIRVLPATTSYTYPIVFRLNPGKNLGERYFQLTISPDLIELILAYESGIGDRLTLIPERDFFAVASNQPWYWLSLDAYNKLLKYGRGEAAEKNTAYCFDFSDTSQGPTLPSTFPGVEGGVRKSLAAELLSSIKYWFATGPIYIRKECLDTMVIPQPKLIIDSRHTTLEILSATEYIPIQQLPVELGELYGSVGGENITLEDPNFRFAEAIHASVITVGGWCYEKLKQKCRGHDPRANYLRITLGKNKGTSPGIPYVMEIWPPHCYSSIHKHSNTYAIIKVLANQVHVDMFSELSVCNQEAYDSVDLIQGQVTYITPNLHQIHKITNQTAETSVTLQCYRYPNNDHRHYEYFDFIRDGEIKNFTPNSDSDFLKFKKIIMSERLSNVHGPIVPTQGGDTDMQSGPPLSFRDISIEVKPNILQIIKQHHLHATIFNTYPNTYIGFQESSLKITARSENIQEVVKNMQNLLVRIDFDPNARWFCLQNDGHYLPYDPVVSHAIESAYQRFFPELFREGYVNYSRSVEVATRGSWHKIQFAQIGGVHRQIWRQGTDAIRAVRREANGEVLNKRIVKNYKWLWLDDNDHFKPYEDDAIFLIEQSYVEWKAAGGNTNQNIKSVLMQGHNSGMYKIEYATMKQLNNNTGFARPIKRETV